MYDLLESTKLTAKHNATGKIDVCNAFVSTFFSLTPGNIFVVRDMI